MIIEIETKTILYHTVHKIGYTIHINFEKCHIKLCITDGFTMFDSLTCTCDNMYVYAGGDVNTYTPDLVNCTIVH